MEHYNFHSTRDLVAQHNERRVQEACAERLARQIRRRSWIDPRALFVRRPATPRPEWSAQ